MALPGKDFLAKRLAAVQLAAFLVVIVLLWLDELIDIPYLLLGAEATPVNWREALFETMFIAPIGIVTVYFTRVLVRRLRILEGFLPICASCKNIRDNEGNWLPMEDYIGERSEAKFSHGICPQCAKKLYPEVFNKEEPPPGSE